MGRLVICRVFRGARASSRRSRSARARSRWERPGRARIRRSARPALPVGAWSSVDRGGVPRRRRDVHAGCGLRAVRHVGRPPRGRGDREPEHAAARQPAQGGAARGRDRVQLGPRVQGEPRLSRATTTGSRSPTSRTRPLRVAVSRGPLPRARRTTSPSGRTCSSSPRSSPRSDDSLRQHGLVRGRSRSRGRASRSSTSPDVQQSAATSRPVETKCGSHTHTLVPERGDRCAAVRVVVRARTPRTPTASLPHDLISIVEVPLGRTAGVLSVIGNEAVLFPDGGNDGGQRLQPGRPRGCTTSPSIRRSISPPAPAWARA